MKTMNTMDTTHQSHRRRGGFTLVEVAIATILIAVGLAALMNTLRAGTSTNYASSNMTTASFLAQNVHEWTLGLPFRPAGATVNPADLKYLDDLNGMTFSPPRDGAGLPINNYAGWSQRVTMTWRNAANLTPSTPPSSGDAMHVSVDIRLNGETVTTLQYLIFKRQDPTAPGGGGGSADDTSSSMAM